MLAAVGRTLADTEVVSDADLPELIRSHDWADSRLRQGRIGPHRDPALVFSTMQFENAPPAKPVLEQCPAGTPDWLVRNLLGHGGRHIAREDYNSRRGICRPRVQYDTVYGCPHGCQYCAGGKVAVVNCNLEEFIDRQVKPDAAREPWQKVFMYNSSLSDTLTWEPEYGLTKLLAEFYATTVDQHQLIHTKSANVDFLTELDHQGHTIVLWSLTSDTASRIVEPRTGTASERIEAAAKLQAAGYHVRFKLKPIVPIKGWRDEYRAVIDQMLKQTRPDSIGLFMLAWMDAEEVADSFNLDLFDPAFVKALWDSADDMRNVTAGPFPHDKRAEVYQFMLAEIRRHDAEVPVFICTETHDMWEEFAPKLGLNPKNYICGCGPQTSPGLVKIDELQVPVEIRTAETG